MLLLCFECVIGCVGRIYWVSGIEVVLGVLIGLFVEGCGLLVSWCKCIGVFIIDWGVFMVLVSVIFGLVVIWGGGWFMWMLMVVFFVEFVLFIVMIGGFFG